MNQAAAKTGRRNGIFIGALVVLALLIYSELSGTTSFFSNKEITELKLVSFEDEKSSLAPQASAGPGLPPSPPHHKNDGGLFIIIKAREDHLCGDFETRSTNPVSALSNQGPARCMAVDMGLLFHTIEPSMEVSKDIAANSAAKLAAWAKTTSHCGDVTIIAMPHGEWGSPRRGSMVSGETTDWDDGFLIL